MSIRVAINGFGRIGRLVLRAIVESGRDDIVVVSVNDLGPVETNAHLLRYDSIHGRFPGEVKVDGENMIVGGHKIKVTPIKDPAVLPHKELGVDIALECTGIFTSKEKASRASGGRCKARAGFCARRRRGPDRGLWREPQEADARITSSFPMHPARPIAWRRWRRCCTKPRHRKRLYDNGSCLHQ